MIKFLTTSELKPKKHEWHLDQFILKGSVGYIAGRPGCGKTKLALTLAMQSNKPFIYISPETSLEYSIAPYIHTYKNHINPEYNVDHAQFPIRVIEGQSDLPFLINQHSPNLIRHVRQSPLEYSYIIIDTGDRLLGDQDNNSKTAISYLVDPYIRLADEKRCTVLLILHTSKESNSPKASKIDMMNRTIGSIGWPAVCRFGITVLKALPHPEEEHDNTILFVKSKGSESKHLNDGYICHIDDYDGVGLCTIGNKIYGTPYSIEKDLCIGE